MKYLFPPHTVNQTIFSVIFQNFFALVTQFLVSSINIKKYKKKSKEKV